MSVIVERDGVRFRARGEMPDLSSLTDADMKARRLPGSTISLVPLPRVPGWPKEMGPAPQYLSDDPDVEVRPGDTVLIKEPYDWVIQYRGKASRLGKGPDDDWPSWLIARADGGDA